MMLIHSKKSLQDLLSQSRTKIVIEKITNILKPGAIATDQIIQLSSRFYSNNRSFDMGTKDRADFELEERKIVSALLNLISELEEKELKNNYSLELGGITNPILVLCFNKTQEESMKRFFSRLTFTNVVIEFATAYEDRWNDKFQVTIWNNTDLAKCPDNEFTEELREKEVQLLIKREKFLEECLLKNPSPHFIHFGEPYYFVQQNRNRVYAANSEYSLFARIQEMLAYINALEFAEIVS